MPKTMLGKPVDEEKWSRAKALAAKEGHAEDYAYITSIYKKLAHLGKSVVDSDIEQMYTKGKSIKLVLGQDSFDEFRCGDCRALLFRGARLHKSFIEVKCRRCGTLNVN